MTEKILEVLLQKGGGFGVLAAVLLFGLYRVYTDWQKEREAHRLAMLEAQTQRDAEHERRLADQKQWTETVMALLNRVSPLLEIVREKLTSRRPPPPPSP